MNKGQRKSLSLLSVALMVCHPSLCITTLSLPLSCIYNSNALFSASVFAYGQTSSGKTYTMSGITDCALVDIYGYIDKVKKANIILISYYFTSEPIM